MKGVSISERKTKQQQELLACPGVMLITSMETMRGWGSTASAGTQGTPGAGNGATPPPARRLATVGSGLVVRQFTLSIIENSSGIADSVMVRAQNRHPETGLKVETYIKPYRSVELLLTLVLKTEKMCCTRLS